MYKTRLFALTLSAALTAGGLIASAQTYSREVKVPGITGLISHDAVPEGFDPVSASDSQLEEFGFPPRPDANDASFSRWVQAVSFTRVSGQYINTGRYHRPNQSKGPIVANTTDSIALEGSTNWSGFAITGGSTLTKVEGEWIVPSVNNQFGISGNGYMSEWVGIDGDCSCDDLIQDGTEQDWVGGKPGYYAWIEFIPEAELEISSFPVSPGDVMEMYAWETKSGGVVKGNYFLANFNTKLNGSTSLTIPPGTKFSGKSAELIVEKTQVNGSTANPLPFYADTWMGFAYAFRNSNTAIPLVSNATQNIVLCPESGSCTTGSSGTVLSTASSLSNDSLWFTWHHYE
jgi:peptidase A4-like protein